MASTVRVVLAQPGGADDHACDGALGIFHQVEAECSRFDPASDLSRANSAPEQWHRVGPYCYRALEEAWHAYRWTRGRFDPRVLSDLVALGYDRWPPSPSGKENGTAAVLERRAPVRWRPRLVAQTRSVRLGGTPVDLGGIGKGLAVRWASRSLGHTDHLVEAGGDCYCAGVAPDGGPWRVGVEDPNGSDTPLAVLGVSNLACTTSSVRLRRWTSAGRKVHHLIDPVTGLPGGAGLLSVTVIGRDPAVAEVWSKALFLCGAAALEAEALRHCIAACWVTDDGALHVNGRASEHVLWHR